ncbi:MAG: chromate resistance protein [Thermoplasmata archaeon]|nr:chromate resistance protein [Thermoplasmata archaeon]
MKWVTRAKAKVDRIACPWLILRFVDPSAEFLYVPADRVLEVARSEGATPFDTPGAELHHFLEDGQEFVTFDALLRRYQLTDPALHELAKIVRKADAGVGDAVEGAGLEAAALGFRAIAQDDFANQRLQFPLYDALYAYCQAKVKGGAQLEHAGAGPRTNDPSAGSSPRRAAK